MDTRIKNNLVLSSLEQASMFLSCFFSKNSWQNRKNSVKYISITNKTWKTFQKRGSYYGEKCTN